MMSLTVNTDQEAFDAVVTRFFDGRGQAMTKNADGLVKCQYRTVDGNVCAIGALIELSSYREWYEGQGVEQLVRHHSLELGRVVMQLLIDLQLWHDSSGNWNGNYPSVGGVGELHGLAAGWGLDDSIIERLRGW